MPFAITPPRPRKKMTRMEEVGEEDDAQKEDQKKMIRFNRIYGRDQEPVIVRQQPRDSQYGKTVGWRGVENS